MAEEWKVRLKSSDDEMFEVDEAVAFESQRIKNMIEGTGAESAVPLPNVSSKILAKVIEYCMYHVEAAKTSEEKTAISEEDVKIWDSEFVKVDMPTLFGLVRASYDLNIKNLVNLTCQAVADEIIKGNPNIIIGPNCTPEEEEVVRRENKWAFE